jgi:hypothetical protein
MVHLETRIDLDIWTYSKFTDCYHKNQHDEEEYQADDGVLGWVSPFVLVAVVSQQAQNQSDDNFNTNLNDVVDESFIRSNEAQESCMADLVGNQNSNLHSEWCELKSNEPDGDEESSEHQNQNVRVKEFTLFETSEEFVELGFWIFFWICSLLVPERKCKSKEDHQANSYSKCEEPADGVRPVAEVHVKEFSHWNESNILLQDQEEPDIERKSHLLQDDIYHLDHRLHSSVVAFTRQWFGYGPDEHLEHDCDHQEKEREEQVSNDTPVDNSDVPQGLAVHLKIKIDKGVISRA